MHDAMGRKNKERKFRLVDDHGQTARSRAFYISFSALVSVRLAGELRDVQRRPVYVYTMQLASALCMHCSQPFLDAKMLTLLGVSAVSRTWLTADELLR